MALPRLSRLWRLLAVMVLSATLIWAGWYVYDKGFGRRWRAALAKEFERYGLVVTARRLTLDPFHGLVAKDVQILGGPERQNVLAEISDIALDVNYANLFTHEQALNAVDLRDAQISVPLDVSNPEIGKLAIKNLHARVYFFPGRIDVRQVTGDFCGIRLTASGTLVNPNRLRPELGLGQVTSEEGYHAAARFAQKVIGELRSLAFEDVPQLNFTFQADLNDLASFRIPSGRLTAAALSRAGYRLSDLDADFGLENRRINLIRMQVRDARGELFAKANWDFATGQKQFQVRSTLDLARLLSAEPHCAWARDFSFQASPEVELAGVTTETGKSQYFGRLSFDRFVFRTVAFQSLKAEFSRAGDSWMIHDAEATHATGTLSGDVLHLPGNFRIRVNSALDPVALAPLFPGPVQTALASWEFQTAPVIQASLSGQRPAFDQITGTGRIFLGRTRFRGHFLNSASATFKLQDNGVECRDVRINRDEGVGTGAFRYNFEGGAVTLTEVESTLDPATLVEWISPSIARAVQPLTWTQTPVIRANGTTQTSGSAKNNLAVDAVFPGPFTYRVGGVDLHFDSAQMHLAALGDRLEISSFTGKIGEGVVSLFANTMLPPSRKSFQAKVNWNRVPLARAFPTLDFLPQSGCWLNGAIQIRHRGSEMTFPHMDGSLELSPLKLEQYRVFAPILDRLKEDGFSEPVIGTLKFHTNRAALEIDALRLTAGSHTLELTGNLSLLDGELAAEGVIDHGVAHLRAEGPLDHLAWDMPVIGGAN
jgi:hypothetical protein